MVTMSRIPAMPKRPNLKSLTDFLPPNAWRRPTGEDLGAAAFEGLGTTLFLFMSFFICQTVSGFGGSPLVKLLLCSSAFAVSIFTFVSVFYR